MSDKAKGLYRKYRVERLDGSSAQGRKHAECEYFVLDLVHDEFATKALISYAIACSEKYPKLAVDLRARVRKIAEERGGKIGFV